MDGLLVVDKPAGPTSHDVVARMRRLLGERRIGHTGTLDPMATGVLLLVLGKATRLARFLSASDKSYDAVVRLGFATDTGDAQGRPLGPASDRPMPSRETIDAALTAFRGTFSQQPPAFSAKKIDGQRSYKLARAAQSDSGLASPARPAPPAAAALPAAVSVTVRALELVSVDRDRVTLRMDCSAGFYVRSLAHDLGAALGIGAHLEALRRTRSGDVTLAQALPLAAAEADRDAAVAAVIPLDRMLPGLAAVVLTEAGARHAAHGRDLEAADMAGGASLSLSGEVCRLVNQHGELLGIGQPAGASGFLHPSVVLV